MDAAYGGDRRGQGEKEAKKESPWRRKNMVAGRIKLDIMVRNPWSIHKRGEKPYADCFSMWVRQAAASSRRSCRQEGALSGLRDRLSGSLAPRGASPHYPQTTGGGRRTGGFSSP